MHVNRIETPEDGKVRLSTPGGMQLEEVVITPGEDNIIFVTLPSSHAQNASILTAQLSGSQN